MSEVDKILYRWICRANQRRDDLGLSAGFIEDSVGILKNTLGPDYLKRILIDDQDPVHFIDDEANPLKKWLLSASVDSHIIEALELAAYFRTLQNDSALSDKVNKLKQDKFWPIFFELAMAARIKRACQTSQELRLNFENATSIGDFTISTGTLNTPCECSRLGYSPQILEPHALEESLIRRINKGTENVGVALCIKIRSGEALTGSTYNRVLQLVRRALADCRKSKLPTMHSDGPTSITFEKLTDTSEQKPFQEINGRIVNVTGSDWVSAMSCYSVLARDMNEVQNRFDAGERFQEYERVRLFIKFAASLDNVDPCSRLTAKLRKKLKQTKVTSGDLLGKIVFIEVPFDLRSIGSEKLRLAIRAAAGSSQTTLAVILAHREPNPQTRYHYSIVGSFNEAAEKTKHQSIIERIKLLSRVIENEHRIDSILGVSFRRSWEDALENARRLAKPSPG